jgi:hypothetical protein
VRQDVADVNPLTVVVNDDDEAIFISRDIEDNELSNLIYAAEDLPHIGEMSPTSRLNNPDPMPYPCLRVRISLPELLQWPPGYQTHPLYFRKLRKTASTANFAECETDGFSGVGW